MSKSLSISIAVKPFATPAPAQRSPATSASNLTNNIWKPKQKWKTFIYNKWSSKGSKFNQNFLGKMNLSKSELRNCLKWKLGSLIKTSAVHFAWRSSEEDKKGSWVISSTRIRVFTANKFPRTMTRINVWSAPFAGRGRVVRRIINQQISGAILNIDTVWKDQ
jgi:hypothetical protein